MTNLFQQSSKYIQRGGTQSGTTHKSNSNGIKKSGNAGNNNINNRRLAKLEKSHQSEQSDSSSSTQPNLKQIIEKLRRRSASMRSEYGVQDIHSSEGISIETDTDESDSESGDTSQEIVNSTKVDQKKITSDNESTDETDSDSTNTKASDESDESEKSEESEESEKSEKSEKLEESDESYHSAKSDSSQTNDESDLSVSSQSQLQSQPKLTPTKPIKKPISAIRASTKSSDTNSGSEFRSIIPPKKIKVEQKPIEDLKKERTKTPITQKTPVSSQKVSNEKEKLMKLETDSNIGSEMNSRGSLTLLKLDKLKQQLESLYNKNSKLQEANEEAAKNYSELVGKNKDLKLLLLDCKEVQQKLRAANDHLEEKLIASHKEQKDIGNQYLELHNQLRDTQKQMAGMEEELRQANNDKVELKKQLCLKIAFALKILHKYIQCKWAISKM